MDCFDSDLTSGGIRYGNVSLEVSKPQACEGYRLATEAEWEYAARSGDQYTPIYQSDGNDGTMINKFMDQNLNQIAHYCGNPAVRFSCLQPSSVGHLEPNGWGLFDMIGNVREWVWDVSQTSYQNDVTTDPIGPTTGSPANRATRGCAFNDEAHECRMATRWYYNRDSRSRWLGFRVCRTLHP
jgi:formylglycine-generating enzyme